MGSSQLSEHFVITHAQKKSCNGSGILQRCLSLLSSRHRAFFRAGLRMHLEEWSGCGCSCQEGRD